MLKRKKKRSQRDWDYEIKKLDEETQLKDSWRYIPVGLDSWKIDYQHNYDPTDDMIESIDRKNNPEQNNIIEKELPAGVEMIERLTPTKQKVVFYYLWDGLSFSKIGKILGLTKQRIHQIYWSAIEDLKVIYGGDNVFYDFFGGEEE